MKIGRQSPSPDQLQAACQAFELISEPELLRHVENLVYRAERKDGPCILRITEPDQRQPNEIAAEMHWLEHLAQAGCRVVSPIKSRSGQNLEVLDQGEQPFSAVCFTLAPGESVGDPFAHGDQFFISWGQLLGSLHQATQSYQPGEHSPFRAPWNRERSYAAALAEAERSQAAEQFEPWQSFFSGLSQDQQVFGLVHRDAHYGNLFVDQGQLTLFDFDDACYHWFIFDLSIPLFFIKYDALCDNQLDRYHRARSLLTHGYEERFHLADEWHDLMDAMIQFQMVVMNFLMRRLLAKQRLTGKAAAWCSRYVEWFADYPHADYLSQLRR